MDKIGVQSSLLDIYHTNVKPIVEMGIRTGSIRTANHKNIDDALMQEKNKDIYHPSTALSPSTHTTYSNVINAKDTKLLFISRPQEYNIRDLENISKRISLEIDKLKETKTAGIFTTKELFAAYPEISDEYLISLLEFGESQPMPDESLNDLQWSLLMQLGSEIGMTDPNGLMQITKLDLTIYFDAKYNKGEMFFDKLGTTDQYGNTVKQYAKPEEIWKDIFLTDEKGEFMRGNGGSLLRNETFTYTSSTMPSEILTNDKLEIKNMDPGSIFRYTIIMNSGDRNSLAHNKRWGTDEAFINSTNTKSAWYNTDYGSMSQEKRLVEYKTRLAFAYHTLVTQNHINMNVWSSDNHEKIIQKEITNSQWVTYKPFQSNGIFQVIKQRPEDIYYNTI